MPVWQIVRQVALNGVFRRQRGSDRIRLLATSPPWGRTVIYVLCDQRSYQKWLQQVSASVSRVRIRSRFCKYQPARVVQMRGIDDKQRATAYR